MTGVGQVDVTRLAEFLASGAASMRDNRFRGISAGGHATTVGPAVGPMMHGPNGLFHVYDAEQMLISLQAHGTSLATMLPSKGSNFLNPLFGYIGGWGPGGGEDEPDTSCEPGPTQGSLYTCWQTAQFGRYKRSTTVIDVADVGQYTGRSEFSDFLLLNPPLFDGLLNISPQNIPGGGSLSNINREFILRMMGLGIEFERLLGPQVYYGNPDNNKGPGGYAEFPGLDILISHGHMDALRPGVVCDGLDSLLWDYQYASVQGDDGGAAIVSLMTAVMRYLRNLASVTNLNEVTWVMAMREELFNAILDVWPCAYLSNRCFTVGDGIVGNIDLTTINGLREAMRTGSYLEVDGRRIPVVTDPWIHEGTSVTATGHGLTAGEYTSDIYIVPTTIRNNVAATYFEYLNWDGAPMEVIRDAGRTQYFATSDGGTYLWTLPPPTETCLFSSATVRPRLIELAPHLSAKISHLKYSPLIHTRDSAPGDSFYNLSGSDSFFDYGQPPYITLWS